MTKRCNTFGIRIYADIMINHMRFLFKTNRFLEVIIYFWKYSFSGGSGTGTAGSSADHDGKHWPGVPFGPNDFNPKCDITNYNDINQVRNCWLLNLADLNQSSEYVRTQIAAFLNHLIDLGVAGFRVDAMKHM